MPTAFITGATGFIGRNLIDVLNEGGWQITALYRKDDDAALLAGLGVTAAKADLTDLTSLKRAIPDQTDYCFHVAADTSPWRGHRQRQALVNVAGTQSIVTACLDNHVGRLVHVSTVAVYGPHSGTITEKSEQFGYGSWVGYVHTKAQAERRVRTAVERGLDAVICNPGHILGKYDSSTWARMFRLVQQDLLPGAPPGKGCFANGPEVAKGLVAAAEKGVRGENYLMGGPYASFREVVGIIAQMLGKDKEPGTVPALLIKAKAHFEQFKSTFTGHEPGMTPEAAYFVCKDEKIDDSKARQALGYQHVPIRQSLEECFTWLVEQGHLKTDQKP